MTALACGAEVTDVDVVPCPDPYCRVCRDYTGEVIDRPISEGEAIAAIVRAHEFRYSSEDQLQQGLTELLAQQGFDVAREVRLNPRDRIDLLVGRVGIEVKVAGTNANVARQCARYLKSDKIDELVLVTNRTRHVLGVGPDVQVVSIARPW